MRQSATKGRTNEQSLGNGYRVRQSRGRSSWILAIITLLTSCARMESATPTTSAPANEITVYYRVLRLDGKQSSAKVSYTTASGVQQITIPTFPEKLGASAVFWQSPNYLIPAGRPLELSALLPTKPSGHFECEIDTVGQGYNGVSSASSMCSVSGTPPFGFSPSP